MNIDSTLLALIVPIVLIQLALIIVGLHDLMRPDRQVRGDSKVLWGIVIVVINLFGPMAYFLAGRKEA